MRFYNSLAAISSTLLLPLKKVSGDEDRPVMLRLACDGCWVR